MKQHRRLRSLQTLPGWWRELAACWEALLHALRTPCMVARFCESPTRSAATCGNCAACPACLACVASGKCCGCGGCGKYEHPDNFNLAPRQGCRYNGTHGSHRLTLQGRKDATPATPARHYRAAGSRAVAIQSRLHPAHDTRRGACGHPTARSTRAAVAHRRVKPAPHPLRKLAAGTRGHQRDASQADTRPPAILRQRPQSKKATRPAWGKVAFS